MSHAFVTPPPPPRPIDNERAHFYGLNMGKLRIAWLKMLLALKLVTVLSLALLPFSISPAAAHGGSHRGYDTAANMQAMPGHSDHQVAAHCAPSSGAKSKASDDQGKTTAKQDCCTAFCIGVAVLTDDDMPRSGNVTPHRGVAPDHQVSPGEVPNLKRPPKA